jgi:ABC-type microcin C transport system duplicated ATPase subunit YejF
MILFRPTASPSTSRCEGILRRPNGAVRAVDGVSFTIEAGRTLGVVGESGCGKSTTAKLVLKLEEPTGARSASWQAVADLDAAGLREYRKSVQAVFQDPFASLNPHASDIVAEPLVTNEKPTRGEARKRVARLLEMVGLPDRAADLFPHEFSGGQRQRIAIARALALSPLVVLDERCPRWTSRSARRSSTCCATCSATSAWPTCSSPTTWR